MSEPVPDRLAIVLLDHGSRRPEAGAHLAELRDRIAVGRPEALVVAAHLEVAPPTLGDAIDRCVAGGATRIVVHPFFLLPGRHTLHDVPEQIEQARARHPGIRIVQSEPVGLTDALVEIVLRRIADADA
jgi:sirohydrochlorin ferrochelatase